MSLHVPPKGQSTHFQQKEFSLATWAYGINEHGIPMILYIWKFSLKFFLRIA